eukprot:9302677-Alexandrium_andersonii.AAC.1
MVLDERRLNPQCKNPPAMPMGSPSCCAHWDLSEAAEQQQVPVSFTGDLPDWFYRIKAPNAVRPYFVLRDILPALLAGALAEAGRPAPSALEGARAVCLTVVLMGWSWGP